MRSRIKFLSKTTSRNSARLAGFFYRHFLLWRLKPIHRLWTAYQSLWRCVVTVTATPD
nr:MAG TPA: hypothetical protein [Caudoviricetes sp.]